ncbi:MAG TPA: aldehyde dehydrogenase family protein [Chloroflexota bacterium]|nr:aldehyde dehydrogenase family protein [Chloroflexota bacterium]
MNMVDGQRIAAGTEWATAYARAGTLVPDAFGDEGRVLNLIEGSWGWAGHGKPFLSPNDGSLLGTFPMIDMETARRAVHFAAGEYEGWARVDLDERRSRVEACIERLREHRDLLATLLAWEIGKPFAQAQVSVDRCISGVEWYIRTIEPMLEGRRPLGLVSNIASWNYPLSVLVHAMLVQMLAGNAVIAKTPSDGGLCTLTLALGLARQCELPVSLVSGSGGQLSEALVRNEAIACLSFVGGKTNGRDIAASLYDREKRYMLEMEGVNAYGIWDFSDWSNLAAQIKKGFEYGKQRCTSYPRYVIQRELFPRFLDMYLPVLGSLRIGHPLLAKDDESAPPVLDFGPLINGKAVENLRVLYSEAIGKGAISIYEGRLDESLFFPEQDTSTYIAPAALINVPRNCALYHKEPFGPVDTIVIVDSIEELVAEMNVSNGSLVSSIACDDPRTAQRIAGELRGFKVGVNKVRSRGDREEPFGGIGESWKGCFVGGEYLVRAVTQGPAGERLHGNFPDYTLLPERS